MTSRIVIGCQKWEVGHDYVALEGGLRVSMFNRIVLAMSECAECGAENVVLPAMCREPGTPAQSPEMDWRTGPDAGLSSTVIWAVMLGISPQAAVDTYPLEGCVPHDADDFGRCHRLLERFPAWRGRMAEVVAKVPAWEGLVREWERLEELYAGQDAGFNAALAKATEAAP